MIADVTPPTGGLFDTTPPADAAFGFTPPTSATAPARDGSSDPVLGSGPQISQAPEMGGVPDHCLPEANDGWLTQEATPSAGEPLSWQKRTYKLLSSPPAIFLMSLLVALLSYPLLHAAFLRLQGINPYNEGMRQGVYFHRERFLTQDVSLGTDGETYVQSLDFRDCVFVHNNLRRAIRVIWNDDVKEDIGTQRIENLPPQEDGILAILACNSDTGLPDDEAGEGSPQSLTTQSPKQDGSPSQDLTWSYVREGEEITITIEDHNPLEGGLSVWETQTLIGPLLVSQTYLVRLSFDTDDLFFEPTEDGTARFRFKIAEASKLLLFDEPEGPDLYIDGVRIPRADEANGKR